MYTFRLRFLSAFILVCLLAMIPGSYAQAQTINYIDRNATGNTDGMSLTNAYTGIQPAPAAAIVTAGTYDDTNSNWVYSGDWIAYTGSGPYNNSIHYTTTAGAAAELQFNGVRFALYFTKYSNRGLINVYVDSILVTTINASSTTLDWQQTYMSPLYTAGNHTLRVEHGGGGTHIDMDVVQVYGSVPAGTYDDSNINWVYTGNWTYYSGSGPYNSTMHYTGTVGSAAELGFNGTRFILTFTRHSNRGSINVYVDGGLVTTINTNNPTILWQQSYTSPIFLAGDHRLRLEYASGFSYIDVDAVQIYSPVAAGTYDDTDSNWVYSGTWPTYTGSGPYNNTIHYATTAGASVELPFNGIRFTLYFTKYSNRGLINVYVDGGLVTTINAGSTTLDWQQTYNSPIYPLGNHVVRLEHGGGGSHIDIDAIQIHNSVSAGTYDDTNSNWVYSGTWLTYTGSGPYNDSMHYTHTVGDYAELGFYGTRFILTFSKNTNRGSIGVYVDGGLVTTINANDPAMLWQQTYTSPIYPVGNHRVRLVYASGGDLIDVDTIQIHSVSTPVTTGTYDDTDSNWSYSSGWIAYTGSGPYNNTIHYTSTPGNYADLLFIGTQFTLYFTKYSNRGSIAVYVDSILVTTIDASKSTLAWRQSYTSPKYPVGTHTVRLVHAGLGSIIDIDAIEIQGALPPGTYDDADGNWSYSGAWLTYSGSGPYNNTLHYTTMVGDYAELAFSGSKFTLIYTKHSNRGSIGVYVDGGLVTTINANNATTLWQQTYTSPAFTPGTHMVRFVNMGVGGMYIDLDALTVLP